MKKIKIITLTACLALMFSLMLFSSCSNEDSSSNGAGGAPVIESVMRSGYDENKVVLPLDPVTVGVPKNYYVIHGKGLLYTEKVYFNDFDTYFKPTFVTDTDIVILLDGNTPYAGGSNQLKIVTKTGSVIYDFVIMPPYPVFNWFNPMNAAVGDIVTINGDYFVNPILKIGDVVVPIESSSLTKLTFKMPAGASGKRISVSTVSGSSFSANAIGSSIYDDKFYFLDPPTAGWGISNVDLANTTVPEVAQGLKAIKYDIDAWSGFQVDMWNNSAPVPVGAIGIRFQMKASTACGIGIIVNQDWGHIVPVSINGKYAEYVVKWADLGLSAAPASIGSIVFFNNATAGPQYIDDIGFKF